MAPHTPTPLGSCLRRNDEVAVRANGRYGRLSEGDSFQVLICI